MVECLANFPKEQNRGSKHDSRRMPKAPDPGRRPILGQACNERVELLVLRQHQLRDNLLPDRECSDPVVREDVRLCFPEYQKFNVIKVNQYFYRVTLRSNLP